jgi:hypothetical protein
MSVRRLLFSRGFDVAALLLAGVLAYEGFHELFSADYPRLLEPGTTWAAPRLRFNLNAPTVSHLLMLVGGLICVLLSAHGLQRRHAGLPVTEWSKRSQVAGLFSALFAYFVAIFHFMASAGAVG